MKITRTLIAFLILVFAGNAFGQSATAIYTVTSTSAATQTGTKPTGAGHTYSQTFGTAKQITSGNSATLTLTGYAGYKITGIVLQMRSNTSAGAGTLSVVAGSTSISSVSPTANFNTASWYGAWSTAYVNVNKTPTAYNITTGQNVVITIAATTNSLYIQSYSITYEPVCTAPTLSGASQAATVCEGSNATINLTGLVASSTGNDIDYTINGVAQTQITGVNASGTGTASFTSATLTAANNGQTLQITKITNGSCSTTFTTNATLSVSPTTVGGSVGGGTSVCSGTNSTSLSLTGQTGSVVKWQYSTDNWVTPIDITNTTTSQNAINLTQTTKYRAVVQSGACSVANSSDATVTVVSSSTSIAPITTQNLSVSVPGSTLTATEGSTPTSRQWYYGTSTGGPYGTAISGETNPTYTPNFGSAGTYYVVCKSTYGAPCSATITSSEVLINVTSNTITTSAISGSPYCSGATVSVPFTYSPAGNFPSGGSCTFTAELSDASGSFASATAIGTVVSTASGSQTITATIPGATTTGTGYRIRVTSNSPAVTGSDNGANLTINTTVTPSVNIASSPAAVLGVTTICTGTSVTFTATPTNGGSSPTYQWKLNGGNVGTNSVTYSNSALANTDVVTCEMTSNAVCPTAATVISNTITMTVNALVTPAVSIVSSPAAVAGVTTICSGTAVTFTPTPTNGGASPTYNWWKNGVGTGTNLGTSATYTGPTLADADAIACVMTSNATCPSPTTATSNTITITNNTPATPTYTASSSAVAPGQTGVVYTVTSVAGVSYTWSYSGTGATITGTGNSVTVDFSTIATSGNIHVVASKSGCLNSPASVAVTVTASAASDIQFNSGSSASNNTNIDYTLYQGTTLTNTGTGASGSIGVMGFTVRDGGGTTDADALGTDLSAITFSVTNSANIRNARIFNGSSPVGSVVSVSGGNLTFTGLTGLTTTDGGTLALNLRVTFNSTVTDNQKMVFTVTSASTGSSSSTFASGNAGGAYSDNNAGNDINRIEVTATKLAFVQQPTTTSISNTMSPSPTVRAIDANNNLDLDYTASVSITSTGTMTGSPISASASSGLATFSSVVHTVAGTGYTLSATSGSLTGATSSTFDINTYVNGDWYSITGTGLLWNTVANWQQVISGVLSAPGGGGGSGYPNTGNPNVHILGSMSTNGSRSVTNLTIYNGAQLTTTSGPCTVAGALLVKKGGTMNMGNLLNINGSLEVEDSATFIYAYTNSSSRSTSVWNGTENFHPNSNFVLTQAQNTAGFLFIEDKDDITANTYNGFTACFGNMSFERASGTGALGLFPSGFVKNLAHGNVVFKTSTSDIRMADAGSGFTSTIGGSLIIESGFSNNVIFSNSAITGTLTVKGNVVHNGTGALRFCSSATGTATNMTLNIDSNMSITSSGNFTYNATNGSSYTGVINLKGDLTVASTAVVTNASTATKGALNFRGIGDGSTADKTQLVSVSSGSGLATRNQYINFNICNGAYVQLGANLDLGNSAKVTDSLGATLDFGFNGSTPLYVTTYSSGAGFESRQGSTLKITDPDGILYDVASLYSSTIGNVRTITKTNRSYSPLATFWYIGKTNQYTGDGINSSLSSTGNGRQVIVDLIDNNTSLTPDVSFALSNDNTLSATGGKLDVRKGQFIETNTARVTLIAAYILGSTGTLYMSPGTLYKIVQGYNTLTTESGSSGGTYIPRMLGSTFAYTLTGGTIELAGTGASHVFQTLRGGRTYKNIKFSGANSTYSYPTLTDYKNLSSNTIIDSTLIITNDAIVDCIDNSGGPVYFRGPGGLTMSGSGSRMRMKSLNETLPLLAGFTTPYSLTGGTVEWYGTSSSQTHSLRGTDSNSVNINYFNVDVNSTGANVGAGGANVVAGAGFGVAGTMNVNSPACFQLGSGFTITGAGTSTFEVKPGATFKYGGSIATSGATGNVRTGTRTFPTTASYGFVGSITPQDPGTGLPSKMVNMYLDKAFAGNLVTITQDEEITDTLVFYTGIVKTNSSTINVSNLATNAIKAGNTSGNDKYVQGRLQRKVDGSSTYSFPIGHNTQNAQGFTITPTGTSGSDVLGYLEANSTTPVKTVAYCDLETKTAAGQQIGQGSAGADGALDQVVFNLASPLQWDITNPGGGITSYNVTVNANGGQDISPVTSAGGTPIRYLLKNGEPGNTGFTTASGGVDYPTVGFIACPNQYTLSGMTSFSKFTVNGANAGGTGLPVKLIYFTGKKVENYSQLDWATAIEIDNEKFVVERSGDGVHFEAIGSVKGAGSTTVRQDYQWMDKTPLSGWNYYRLKQVDFDGDFEYTNIVAVNFDGDETAPSIIVYPSPSKDFINVQILGSNQIVEAVLYNMIGQAVKNVTPNERMSVEDLPSGEYFIKVIMGNNVVVKQFVKE